MVIWRRFFYSNLAIDMSLFSRPKDTYQSSFFSKKSTPSLIFAYGETDPTDGGDIYYHSFNRGTKKLNILGIFKKVEQDVHDSQIYEFEIKNV